MQLITQTVNSKGQVTIPQQVLDQLGLRSGDKITFLIDDAGRVELRPTSFQWKDLRGIIPAVPGKESID